MFKVCGMEYTLYQYRTDNGLSQAQLAESLGISVGYVSLLERGLWSPSVKVAKRISEVTGIPIAKLRPDLAEVFGA